MPCNCPPPVDESGPIIQMKANELDINYIFFDNDTSAGHLILLYEAQRDGPCTAGNPGLSTTWLPLSADVSTNGESSGDHGRWWYTEADGTNEVEIGATDGLAYETGIDFATFDPGDVTLYEVDNAGPSGFLDLGPVTAPSPGQIILYGATYDTAFTGSWPASPWPASGTANWAVDHNANANAANPPVGPSDQHPHWLVMRWGGVAPSRLGGALYGSAAIGLAQPYCGVMIQLGAFVKPAQRLYEVPAGAFDGANTDYSLHWGWVPGRLEVRDQGLDVTANIAASDPVAGTFTLDYAPAAPTAWGRRLQARYKAA